VATTNVVVPYLEPSCFDDAASVTETAAALPELGESPAATSISRRT